MPLENGITTEELTGSFFSPDKVREVFRDLGLLSSWTLCIIGAKSEFGCLKQYHIDWQEYSCSQGGLAARKLLSGLTEPKQS